MASPLEFEIELPPEPRDGAAVLVLLHGRGADSADLLPLRSRLHEQAIAVCPQAPFPAAPWGYGPGWAWYRFLGGNTPDPETFEESQIALGQFLRSLEQRLPVRPGPIVLGGFSQGGTMSLAHALRGDSGVRYVLNFSGFLANHRSVRVTPDSVAGIRIFWGHGTHDPAIPFELARAGRKILRDAGADLVELDYEIGHWIDRGELDDARDWLAKVLDEDAVDPRSGAAG